MSAEDLFDVCEAIKDAIVATSRRAAEAAVSDDDAFSTRATRVEVCEDDLGRFARAARELGCSDAWIKDALQKGLYEAAKVASR